MAPRQVANDDRDVWFVYDGDCPICHLAATSLAIRREVGELRLVNARVDHHHPLVIEINALGLDLDEGMVLSYSGTHYHGRDALNMMALLGSSSGWFNRMNALLFRSERRARWCYPLMRATRNFLIRCKGVAPLHNLDQASAAPAFQHALGKQWERLPQLMLTRLGIRPYTDDQIEIIGELDICVAWYLRQLSRLSGMLVPHQGQGIPVSVHFSARPDDPRMHWRRRFEFPNRKPIQWTSSMTWDAAGQYIIEWMRFGVGWRFFCDWDGASLNLHHRGYVWRLLGMQLPIPLHWITGRACARETPVSTSEFEIEVKAEHPLLGQVVAYSGRFHLVDTRT